MNQADLGAGDGSDVVHANDDFDDVFCSAPGTPQVAGGAIDVECSDVPRIKEMHETNGYREGITRGKEMSLQSGFDEGYGLGAALGLRVGKVLGLLEGIREGIAEINNDGPEDEEAERVQQLCRAAGEELGIRQIFGKQWWTDEGLWTYKVRAKDDSATMTFEDVAREHPSLKKWEEVVGREARRWNLNLNIFGTNIPGFTDDSAQKA